MNGRLWKLAIVGVIALSLVLRIAGARGELFLDEIWTLKLLQPVTSPAQIFAIHHDNNHYLTSAWMYALGPAAPALQLRALSIAFGMAGIAAAGWWGRARGPFAALAAMLLMAVCYAPVQYGSEARGYSGLILFTVLAFGLTERVMQGDKSRWTLAVVALLGLLCHLGMVLALAAAVMWAAYVQINRQSDLVRAAAATFRMFLPALLFVAPLAVLVGRSMLDHGFVIGMLSPFSASEAYRSCGLLVRALTGVPWLASPVAYLILPLLALALGVAWRAQLGGRLPLYVIAITVLPLSLILLRVPNTNQPRYFLVSGTAYLLLVADLAGIAWNRRLPLRVATACLLLLFVGEEGVLLSHFLKDGRGHYREAVEAMTANGPARYASNDTFRNALIVDHYAAQLGVSATLVRPEDWCAAPPDWYLVYSFSHAAPPPTMTAGPASCRAVFAQPLVYPYWGMSGFQWSLYKR